MKTSYIDKLEPGTRITDYFLVQQCDRKTKKDGVDYLAMKLGDRTGAIDAKLWAIPEGLVLKAGGFVKVEADVQTYRDALQLKVSKIRLTVEEDGVSNDDFIPVSKRDREEMLVDVVSAAAKLQHEALSGALLNLIAAKNIELRDTPAAKTKHQAYLGGLLEHILALIGLANAVCDLYPDLNRDLLIAACIVHDIGKVEELAYDTHIAYTRRGSLVGHVAMGMLIWAPYAQTLDQDTRDHLEHIIASHHGRREWRAVAEPMTREAQIFHFLDMIDAGYELFTNTLNGPLDADGFTPYIPSMGTSLWSGKRNDTAEHL